MNINIHDFLTKPETNAADMCTFLCEYHKLSDAQKDDFFEYRHLSEAFFQFMTNTELLTRVLSAQNVDEDVLYLFGEHFEASDFTYHQAIAIMRQYLTHEEKIDSYVIEDIVENILDNCKVNDDELTKADVEELIKWYKKYTVNSQDSMLSFLSFLLNNNILEPDEIKQLCEGDDMPAYDEVENF